jgi:hypothetical protein
VRKTAVSAISLLIALSLSVACSRMRSDEAITTDLKAKMFSDPQLKSANLNVITQKGVVTLSGEVPDDATRLAAYKLASEMPGVTKVNDQMSVVSAQSAPAPAAEPAPPAEPTKPARRAKPKQVAKPAPVDSPAPAAPAASAATPAPAPAPAAPRPRTVQVPAGSIVTVRMIDSVDSATNHAGEIFRASLDAPIVVDNEVIVPSGADAYVKLIEAKSAGRMTGRSELSLELNRIEFQGKTYTVETAAYSQAGSSRGKRTAATIGGGAALGALIGAVAGGGKGAAIGAAVGAGAGTGVQAATKGQQIKIPSETRLDFRLEQPLEITYIPGKASRSRHSAPPVEPPSN